MRASSWQISAFFRIIFILFGMKINSFRYFLFLVVCCGASESSWRALSTGNSHIVVRFRSGAKYVPTHWHSYRRRWSFGWATPGSQFWSKFVYVHSGTIQAGWLTYTFPRYLPRLRDRIYRDIFIERWHTRWERDCRTFFFFKRWLVLHLQNQPGHRLLGDWFLPLRALTAPISPTRMVLSFL